MKSIIAEFKTFILRGNVIQLAVAVVIGAAFGKVTAAANDHLIQPILGTVGGVPSLAWMDVKYFRLGNVIWEFATMAVRTLVSPLLRGILDKVISGMNSQYLQIGSFLMETLALAAAVVLLWFVWKKFAEPQVKKDTQP